MHSPKARFRSLAASTRLTLLTLLAVSALLPVSAPAADRAPVLLRKTPLLPPVEAVGTETMPEVKVRVEVDRRGAVSAVEVLGIDPSTELDAAFERTTRAELLTWRYAPAVEEGEPVASTLEWTVQFRPSEVGSERDELGDLARLDSLDERLRRREVARNLPLGRQRQMLLDYARIAEKYLDSGRRQEAESPRFVVVTDVEAEGLASAVASNLEVSMNVLGGLLETGVEPYPSDLRTVVYLFARRQALSQMRRELFQLSFDQAAYLPPGFLTADVEFLPEEELLAMLIHEASHAYSDHYLRATDVVMPTWLEEGLAQYLANSEIKKGRILPGETTKRRYVINHFTGGPLLSTTRAGWDVDQVRQSLRADQALSVSDLVGADRLTFYAEDSPLYYASSWLLVHFLRHGEEGWDEDEFPRLMLYLAEGYSGGPAIEAIYGRTLEDLDEDFRRYVKRF